MRGGVKLATCCLVSLHILLVWMWLTAGALVYVRDVYGPSLAFPHPFGKEHLGYCGPSTASLDDLNVAQLSLSEAKGIARTHGVALVGSLLSPTTTKNLRQYVINANHNEKQHVHVIESDLRVHIMPSPNDPAVRAALHEIAQHKVFRPLLDQLLGPRASLVTLSAITNLYGCGEQNWHADTETSQYGYPDYFVPALTLAVALQDTTRAMGATGLCPGTHPCNGPVVDYQALEQEYRHSNASKEYEDFDDWLDYHLPCGDLRAELGAGEGFLYDNDLYHAGMAHTDPAAPERVMVFLCFAASRRGPHDHRSLPLGQTYTLEWNSWGHTIEEFSTIKERPWRFWQAFGFFQTQESGVRPWTFRDVLLLIFKGDELGVEALGDGLDAEYFAAVVTKVLHYTHIATGIYAMVVPILWLGLVWRTAVSLKGTPGQKGTRLKCD